MLEVLENLKTYLETNLNSHLTNLTVTNKTINFRNVNIDEDSNPFKIILKYDGEVFEDLDIATTEAELQVQVIFMVRKTINALDRVLECRTAFIELYKEDETFGGIVDYCQLVKAELDEEIEMIDSKDAKAINITINLGYQI